MEWVLVLVAVAAWVLRVAPLTRAEGAFGYPIDYDEGVYFSASALLFQGHWPYRDFAFVHPPGSLLLWGPAGASVSWLGVSAGFTLARWMAALCGALSVWCVGRLALRMWGPVAALVAALVYASHPELVLVERGPFLEPWLNLACLAAANMWLACSRHGRQEPRWGWTGILLGVAISVKVLGGIWLAAALVAPPAGTSWKSRAGLVLTVAGTLVLLVGPFLWRAPSSFLSEVFLFQALRPGDGELSRLGRLRELFPTSRGVGVGLALLGLALVVRRLFQRTGEERSAERFAAVAYGLTVFAFLTSPSYWSQYNAYLAGPESLLAGLAAAALQGGFQAHRPWAARGVAVLLGVAVLVPPWKSLCWGVLAQAPEVVALRRFILQSVPPRVALFSFEPAWGLAGGHLPPVISGAPLVVDSYGEMLLGALGSGARFALVEDAFQTPAAQARVREVLARSHFVVVAGRGRWQLSEESQHWLHARFVRRFLTEGVDGLDLWEQVPAPEVRP
ncbi:glycosyltransferase family 39 protein [Stigmatella sp. ncwal1]|uniref:Glycosyltransferase family 39 protein n=1 Tax=Stigmatella ashevillensis TaxID=2995309 RepID=A0ABT5DE73_9BACT|nr:glycosyltransferase family 39 protein [Stigmatella ashevillena]MDC0711093.1 glycosyltransferase family 39 protein [Stigmatella ashevillena]